MRNLWGSVVAAAFFVFLPEILRFVGMPNDIAANMHQIIYVRYQDLPFLF